MSQLLHREPCYWDPYDKTIGANPHPVWKRLREQAPLYRNDEYDFYALSRFVDVDTAHREPEIYSSAHGTVLELMTKEPNTGPLMIFLDPPDHTYLRRLVSRAFTPRRVAELEDGIRILCRNLLDEAGGQGRRTFDFVRDYAAIIPAEVIATLLGVEEADRGDVKKHIDGMFHQETDPAKGMVNEVAMESMTFLGNYMTSALVDRKRNPRGDMLTDLLDCEYKDDNGSLHVLGVEGASVLSLLLISAGTETVARLIGWAGVLLATHRAELRLLADDPSLIPNGIEEILRYEAPSAVQGRWLSSDVELYGTVLPKDSRVLLLSASAGRDGDVFSNPDSFSVQRKFGRHMSFGYGVHFCLGAALARMEAKIALEEMLARYSSWEIDPTAAVFQHTSTVRGYSSLPIAA